MAHVYNSIHCTMGTICHMLIRNVMKPNATIAIHSQNAGAPPSPPIPMQCGSVASSPFTTAGKAGAWLSVPEHADLIGLLPDAYRPVFANVMSCNGSYCKMTARRPSASQTQHRHECRRGCSGSGGERLPFLKEMCNSCQAVRTFSSSRSQECERAVF